MTAKLLAAATFVAAAVSAGAQYAQPYNPSDPQNYGSPAAQQYQGQQNAYGNQNQQPRYDPNSYDGNGSSSRSTTGSSRLRKWPATGLRRSGRLQRPADHPAGASAPPGLRAARSSRRWLPLDPRLLGLWQRRLLLGQPGAWVLAPYTGALWTPGYWGYGGGGYFWNVGYWGPASATTAAWTTVSAISAPAFTAATGTAETSSTTASTRAAASASATASPGAAGAASIPAAAASPR